MGFGQRQGVSVETVSGAVGAGIMEAVRRHARRIIVRIHVLIDPVEANRVRAYGGPPFPFIAEGETPYDAVQKLREMIQERLKAGASVCQIDVPAHENDLIQWAGSLKADDPLVQEWIEIMAENRRKQDENPNFPWENNDESSDV